jgi:predicted RNA binding protein YcfA (HicA-like mRNA interferase family)
MVKKQKLYQRLINSQKNVKFDDFVTIIIAFGFSLNRITGSHHIYDHPDVPQSVSIQPDKSQAKPYQIRQFLRLIEKYNLKLSDENKETDE